LGILAESTRSKNLSIIWPGYLALTGPTLLWQSEIVGKTCVKKMLARQSAENRMNVSTITNREVCGWRRFFASAKENILGLFGIETRPKGDAAMSRELEKLIERAKGIEMTTEEKEAQRINFAYGNARLSDECITLEDVVQASQRLKQSRNEQSPTGSS
jgi:hypothetical protein